jgi:hypothetical protein
MIEGKRKMMRFVMAAGLALSLVGATAPAFSQACKFGVCAAGEALANGSMTPVSQTVDPCHKRCAPLLKIDSRSEASRVYRNCRALCAGKGTVTCPDGSQKSVKNPRC